MKVSNEVYPMTAKVVPHKVWKSSDGRSASIFGACPWTSTADKANWNLVESGFTIRWADGTTGIGRQPFATREEAEQFLVKSPRFAGMQVH